MKHIYNILVLALGCGLLTAVLSIFSSKPVVAGGAAPVSVVNTPLPVQGTVNAAQSGAWNVGIAGTPTVNVGNTTSSPVPTKDQYNLALATPVSFTASFTMDPNIFGGESSVYTVPDNKRLVIQYVSMQCDLPGSADAIGKLASSQGLPPGSTAFMGVFVPMRSVPYPAIGAGHVLSIGGTPAEVLFDGGTSVQIDVDRTNGTDIALCFVGFTGYLIAVP